MTRYPVHAAYARLYPGSLAAPLGVATYADPPYPYPAGAPVLASTWNRDRPSRHRNDPTTCTPPAGSRHPADATAWSTTRPGTNTTAQRGSAATLADSAANVGGRAAGPVDPTDATPDAGVGVPPVDELAHAATPNVIPVKTVNERSETRIVMPTSMGRRHNGGDPVSNSHAATVMLHRDERGEFAVVVEADDIIWLSDELIAAASKRSRPEVDGDMELDGDRLTFGTPGEGLGRVAYRITGPFMDTHGNAYYVGQRLSSP